MPVPSVGRDVHYHAGRGIHWAAKITAVHPDGSVTLLVFPPDGPRETLRIQHVKWCSEEQQRHGCCSWPRRVGSD